MSLTPPAHNASGIERNWFESCFRSHAAVCGCGHFVNHLNVPAARYAFNGGPTPPGGPRSGPPQIRRALPAPAPPEPPAHNPWRGGDAGDAAGRGGGRDAGAGGGEYAPEELDALFAAVEEDTQ
ncbi:unnamed protein product [Torque teno virus 23]|uniref:ORF2, ORF1 genes, isolate: s-TTV CH65-2 n=1 Tax=Torque teno virus 23 TaxID=687362 RepID=Q9DTD5_9VIRU|nr:unnamed protein product [Torque teno virus 23]BAB20601.1 unnamed protein product [Torque teno virus 23]